MIPVFDKSKSQNISTISIASTKKSVKISFSTRIRALSSFPQAKKSAISFRERKDISAVFFWLSFKRVVDNLRFEDSVLKLPPDENILKGHKKTSDLKTETVYLGDIRYFISL